MLEKKEKFVLLYLCEICKKEKPYLLSAEKIAEFVSQKYLISLHELNSIMLALSKEDYLDFTPSNGRDGNYYVITLKSKAVTYKRDEKNRKINIALLFAKTIGLSVLSFILGLILKAIFS